MWAMTIYFIFYVLSACRAMEDEEHMHPDRKLLLQRQRPTTTMNPSFRGEVVIEKFVDTLITSEKYLKMVETVERKLNHLDSTFHDKTTSILKFLSEILKVVSGTPGKAVEITLRGIKDDFEKLKYSVYEHIDKPVQRVHQDDMQDSTFDTRLATLESNVKSIMNGVGTVVSIISEVKNRNYATKVTPTKADHVDTMFMMNEIRRGLSEKVRKCDCKNDRVDRSERYPSDCYEILMQGFNVSGIYKIKPEDMEPFYVLCDLTTVGGGWTVLQNRYDGSQDFYKPWIDYRNGFGNLAGEFWLGLDKLNSLTNQKLYELRIEIETQHGLEAYATYSVFTVGPEHEGYRISTLGTFHGTAGDSLSYHAGQKFSTVDVDNDEWKEGACAEEHGGAWWYKECDKSNLNGKYTKSPEDTRGQSIYWISFKGPNTSLTKTRMMIRPLPASRPLDYTDNSRKNPASPHIRSHAKKVVNSNDINGFNIRRSQLINNYTYDWNLLDHMLVQV